MRALWFESGVTRLREDQERPPALPGETRIRVRVAGVCATDLALRRGYMNFVGVPGHEFVGRAIDGPLAGQRVVGDINAACGQCPRCRADNGHHCAQRTVLGIVNRPGCFAEELTLPTVNLVPVPNSVDDDAAVFAEPLAAAFEIPQQLKLTGQERVLVAGDGRLGLLCAMVLAEQGLEVVVAGRHPARSDLTPPTVRHAMGLLEDPTRSRGAFDLGVEATGNPRALQALLSKVAPRGSVVLKTTSEAPAELDLAPLVVDEITLVGSRCGPMDIALDALAAGRIDPRPLIEARYDFDDSIAALDHADRGGVLKILVDME